MIVAMLSAEYPPQPGGIGDYTRRLGQALVERGQHVVVFTITDRTFRIIDVNGSTPNLHSAFRILQSSWGWRIGRDVRAALQTTQPDILHIQYQTGAYGMHPAINFLPWRLRRTPSRPAVVVTAHDLLPPYLFPKAGPVRDWVTRRLLADADAVVVTNEDDFSQVTGNWGLGTRYREHKAPSQSPIPNLQSPMAIPIGSNIAVAPPEGYDRAAWRVRLGIGADITLLAFFGLISRTKGVDTLLNALAQLAERFHLLVIGGAAMAPEDRAYADAVRRQIAQLGLDQRVTITGQCSEADVSAHLLAADIAALPFADGASFRRGSLLAALAHGLPVVTTEPREPRTKNQRTEEPRTSQLVDGENALLVPPENAAALARAIERLANDDGLHERLKAGGRALAAQFGWDTIAAQHQRLYEHLIPQ